MERPSEFPRFIDGDVTLAISATNTYKLHSDVLRRNSPFFTRELDKRPGARLTAQARREGYTAYRFELYQNSPDHVGTFERVVREPHPPAIDANLVLLRTSATADAILAATCLCQTLTIVRIEMSRRAIGAGCLAFSTTGNLRSTFTTLLLW